MYGEQRAASFTTSSVRRCDKVSCFFFFFWLASLIKCGIPWQTCGPENFRVPTTHSIMEEVKRETPHRLVKDKWHVCNDHSTRTCHTTYTRPHRRAYPLAVALAANINSANFTINMGKSIFGIYVSFAPFYGISPLRTWWLLALKGCKCDSIRWHPMWGWQLARFVASFSMAMPGHLCAIASTWLKLNNCIN